MWFRHNHNQLPIFLVIADNQAALITWEHDHDNNKTITHPFVVKSYDALPTSWFLHGSPWHVASCTPYLHTYIQQINAKKPLLICACDSDTHYEKTLSLAHAPTQAAIPPDKQFAHYAWHATSMPALTSPAPLTTTLELSPEEPPATSLLETPPKDTTSYLISGMPHNDIMRLRLCADKSGCTLHRVTTIRASMQPLYTYCQRHGIIPENNLATEIVQNAPISHETVTLNSPAKHTTTSPETLLTMLCAPLPETHNHHLVLSALGLSLFERNHL